MEYYNKSFNIGNSLKSVLKWCVFAVILVIVLKGIFLLIPLGIAGWAVYKVVKFVQMRIVKQGIKKDKVQSVMNEKVEWNAEFNMDDIVQSSIIDVEYEEINK
ncbi:hypothetical protein OW763_12635 [Clostridium aestuarii]|uniref:Uncharacterized protein n=1 Tax=Clostridium aestuarii TaxID=338193 RepID=A0ABT4D4Q9_9CLOT|nr:hypothetical protein [Clostridium aestuarii]MCY6485185.1 hypothetical protein [Clostridium aestuarii]